MTTTTTRTVRPVATGRQTAATLAEIGRLIEECRERGEWTPLITICPAGGVHTSYDCCCPTTPTSQEA